MGTDSKTDKIDAKLLSRMAAERSVTQWQPLSPSIMQLRGQTWRYMPKWGVALRSSERWATPISKIFCPFRAINVSVNQIIMSA